MATNNQGGRPPKPTAGTILNGKLIEAADKGDRLEMLKQLRKMLAVRIEQNNSDRDLAALARQLRQTDEDVKAEQERQNAENRGSWLENMRAKMGYPNATPEEMQKKYSAQAGADPDDEEDEDGDEEDAADYWKKAN